MHEPLTRESKPNASVALRTAIPTRGFAHGGFQSNNKESNMMKDVVIVSGARTAIGSFGGSLKSVSAIDMGALVIRKALEKAGLRPVVGSDMAAFANVKAGFSSLETRVTNLETKVGEIKTDMPGLKEMRTWVITLAGLVIVSVVGALLALVVRGG